MAAVNSKARSGSISLALFMGSALSISFFGYFLVAHITIWNGCRNLQSRSSSPILSSLERFHAFFLHLLKLSESQFIVSTSDPWSEVETMNWDSDITYLCKESLLTVSVFIITSQVPKDFNLFFLSMWNAVQDLFIKSFDIALFNNDIIEKYIQRKGWGHLILYSCATVLFSICGGLIIKKLLSFKENSRSQNDIEFNSSLTLNQSRLLRPEYCKGFSSEKDRRHAPLSNICLLIIRWILVLVAFAIALSIPWEFVRLHQKAVASRAASVNMGLPPECTPDTIGWVNSIKSLLRWHLSWSHDHNPCTEYYYASLVDPLWDVNPLLVLSSVLTRGILHPLEIVSSSLGRSVRIFFAEIPAHWQPAIMFVAVVTAIVILLMLCSYRIHIPLLLRIEPKTPTDTKSKEKHLKSTKSGRQKHLHQNKSPFSGVEHMKLDDVNFHGSSDNIDSPKSRSLSSRSSLNSRRLDLSSKK